MDYTEIMTVREAAQFLRVSRNTLYRCLKQGDLPGRRIGREWRLLKSELIRWMRSYSTEEIWTKEFNQALEELRQEIRQVTPEEISAAIQAVRKGFSFSGGTVY
jgi:excisionase family DNA binding protein